MLAFSSLITSHNRCAFYCTAVFLLPRGIGLCRSATRAPDRPWIAKASRPGSSLQPDRDFSLGCLCKPRYKAKNSSSLSGRQAAVVFLIAKPIASASDGDNLGLLEETI